MKKLKSFNIIQEGKMISDQLLKHWKPVVKNVQFNRKIGQFRWMFVFKFAGEIYCDDRMSTDRVARSLWINLKKINSSFASPVDSKECIFRTLSLLPMLNLKKNLSVNFFCTRSTWFIDLW